MFNWKNSSGKIYVAKDLYFWIKVFPLILSLVLALTIAIALGYLPPKLPLFYSLAWGEGQLANHQQFIILPAIIVLITTLNLIISWQLHPSQSFLKKVLLVSSTVTSLILAVSFFKIILMFI